MTTSRAHLPPNPPAIRLLTNDQARALNARIPSASVTVRNCLTCRGRKTFRWYDAARQVVDYDCPCEEQYVLHRWLLHQGIMHNYQRLGWADLIDLKPETVTPVQDYFDKADRYIQAGIGLVLSGTKGNGKTLLANLLLKEMIGVGVNVYATTFSDMIDSFAEGWHEREQSRWFSRVVRNAGVLYIDDLGRERNKGPSSVGENMLETVVRARVAANQPTIITTNLEPDKIHLGYGGHVMSLLTERSLMVEVQGTDRREEIRKRALAEVEQGLTRPVVLQ